MASWLASSTRTFAPRRRHGARKAGALPRRGARRARRLWRCPTSALVSARPPTTHRSTPRPRCCARRRRCAGAARSANATSLAPANLGPPSRCTSRRRASSSAAAVGRLRSRSCWTNASRNARRTRLTPRPRLGRARWGTRSTTRRRSWGLMSTWARTKTSTTTSSRRRRTTRRARRSTGQTSGTSCLTRLKTRLCLGSTPTPWRASFPERRGPSSHSAACSASAKTCRSAAPYASRAWRAGSRHGDCLACTSSTRCA
mmetsp:Transcript_90741/g.261468  ORF Transcript_90741/g.261468 Transcript_90741/m.261468 type:complete len:258 (-) Transcript_90741:394-1167(-)